MNTEEISCPFCNHHGNNKHESNQISFRCGSCGSTWPREGTLDETHYCSMCEEYGKQLEAAKQRELELLAVIEKMESVAGKHIDPHQALREHEAKVLKEYTDVLFIVHGKRTEKEMKILDNGSALFLIAIIFAFIVTGLAMWADSATCDAQWENSGIIHRWGLSQGCVIQISDKTWIPASSYVVTRVEK